MPRIILLHNLNYLILKSATTMILLIILLPFITIASALWIA